jgi:hypothetical protein
MVRVRERVNRAVWVHAEDLNRLGDRISALAQFVRHVEPYLEEPTVAPARAVVDHAGSRLALSGAHTVVALAGTTGSGKSSLFNALAGAPLSPSGLRRPTTGIAHGAVFSATGDAADALLDWLGVGIRHASDADPSLNGLVLLDLPDIDSVVRGHGVEADRLLELVDLVVWVLDPQKYADLSVHRRYRETFQHHSAITVVAMNQADRLSPEDLPRCLSDLGGILRADGLVDVPVLATSTVDGPGIDALRSVLARAVSTRIASLQRLSADVSAVTERLGPLMQPVPADTDVAGPPVQRALAAAAGIPTVTDSARRSYVYRAVGHTGWPVTRWRRRLRGDPLRRLRLAGARRGQSTGASALPPPSSAARAHVALATRNLGEAAGRGLQPPWPDVLRDVARSRADDVVDALDVAVVRTELGQADTPLWWWMVGLVQLLLLGVAAAGLVWLGVRWAFFALALPALPLPVVGRVAVPTLMFVGGLLAGLVLAWLARVVVAVAARRHATRTRRALTRSVDAVADELVLGAVAQVRADYLAARDALASAAAPLRR